MGISKNQKRYGQSTFLFINTFVGIYLSYWIQRLFPTDAELTNRQTDGIFLTYRRFQTTLDELVTTFASLLKRDKVEFGTHTLSILLTRFNAVVIN